MPDSPTFDVRTIAKLLMVDERRIQQLKQAGWIKETAQRGRYSLVGSVQGYIRYLKEGQKETNRTSENARLLRAQAVKVEMTNFRAMGELMVTAQVEETFNGLVAMMQSLHEGLPGRLANEFAAVTEPPVIYQRLQGELRAILNSCADYLEKRAATLDAVPEPGTATPPAEGSESGPVGG